MFHPLVHLADGRQVAGLHGDGGQYECHPSRVY